MRRGKLVGRRGHRVLLQVEGGQVVRLIDPDGEGHRLPQVGVRLGFSLLIRGKGLQLLSEILPGQTPHRRARMYLVKDILAKLSPPVLLGLQSPKDQVFLLLVLADLREIVLLLNRELGCSAASQVWCGSIMTRVSTSGRAGGPLFLGHDPLGQAEV